MRPSSNNGICRFIDFMKVFMSSYHHIVALFYIGKYQIGYKNPQTEQGSCMYKFSPDSFDSDVCEIRQIQRTGMYKMKNLGSISQSLESQCYLCLLGNSRCSVTSHLFYPELSKSTLEKDHFETDKKR